MLLDKTHKDVKKCPKQRLTKGYIETRIRNITNQVIQLPTFSGIYREWPAYQDLFTSLVHDNPKQTKG